MIYLTQLLGNPVIDSTGETIGTVNDLGIATGEVFPRVTSLAFQGPGKTPFMISWRKYVESFDEDVVRLKLPSTDIRFSYLQPDEVLIARDLLNKQIVDTQGMKVVRVNDLKLSDTGSGDGPANQLRLLGAEVGARGLLRSLSPTLEKLARRGAKAFGRDIPENIIAWNYMDLLDRDLSNVKLSVEHKTLDDMHPADIADIIEQLDPRLRGQVFAQLDDAQAALAMAELDDEEMAAEVLDDMEDVDASKMLSEMDPDDAAELVGELDYERAEKLLRLMGVKERRAVRQLLGYREDTAGRIMTGEFISLPPDATAADAIKKIREQGDEVETIHYLYLIDSQRHLKGVLSLRDLVVAKRTAPLIELAETEDVLTVSPEDDQEDVAEAISKYNLLAMPVVDENNRMLGIVTVDDALDVMAEEHEEDLRIAGSVHTNSSDDESDHVLSRVLLQEMWFFFWMVGMVACSLVARSFDASGVAGLVAGAALPVCLHAADTMVRYVTGFFLEYDEDDEDAPGILAFALKGLGSSIVYAAIMFIGALGLSSLLAHAIGAEGISTVVLNTTVTGKELLRLIIAAAERGFVSAVAIVVVTFASAPGYLIALRGADERGEELSGITLRFVALSITTLLFIVLTVFILKLTMV